MLLQDMINDQIVCLNFGDCLEKAVKIFRNCKIDTIPVVNEEQKLISVFTKSNLYDALLNGATLEDPIDPYANNNPFSLVADIAFDRLTPIVKKSPVGAAPVTDREGKVVGLLTKENMVMTSLRNLEMVNSQLSAILDSMYNGVIVVNDEGRISLINSGAERIFKTTGDHCLGRLLKDVLPELDLSPALENGEVKVGLKFKYEEMTTIANITPLTDGNAIVGAIAIFQDLTDLEQVARELEIVKGLNTTLDTVLNIIYDGIIVIDENGYISLSNRVLREFMELAPEQLTGKHITELFPDSRLHIVAKTGIPETGDIQHIQGKPLIVSKLPIVKDGKVAGAVGKITFPQMAEIRELADNLSFLQNKVAYYQEELERTKKAHGVLDDLIAESAIMKRIKGEIAYVAKSTSTVLITGESGTGKEVIAQAIHRCSDRKEGSFIKVNCAAIPENLLEAEIFGYASGAFTGALKGGKPGRFELADGGTIFLDEVGDMPMVLQAKILRVIQEREFERLGDTRTRKVNVRILAATNKDLQKAIANGEFREDLYYRLNVIGFHLPPLREHPEDIPPLAEKFIRKYNRLLRGGITGVSEKVMEVLGNYHWPGNIRELENVIERAVNYARSGVIQQAHLPSYLCSTLEPVTVQGTFEKDTYQNKLIETEKEMILSAIQKAGGNKTRAAKLLNLSRSRLYVKMKRYGIIE
jgi:transcriptional regulator with PAS, ATPase and Fis domain